MRQKLKKDPAPEAVLLAHPSAMLRMKVLQKLLGRKDSDKEVKELRILASGDPLVQDLISLQGQDGSWSMLHSAQIPSASRMIMTSLALARLGYLGLSRKDRVVRQGSRFLFSRQKKDGSWPLIKSAEAEVLKERYEWMPLQTALVLRGLLACGCARDPRCTRALQWLMDKRLDDGTWPTGWASGNYGYVAGYRKMPHSRWGCRSNTTGVLVCLGLHPGLRWQKEGQRALDLLLGRETRDVQNVGFDIARLLGYEEVRGFITFYGKYDPLLTLRLCAQMGVDKQDERVKELIAFLQDQRTSSGLLRYHRAEATKWVSYELSCLLRSIPDHGDWHPTEPRTPFQAYPKKQKRF
jgi:hypothetical protein